MRKEAPDFNWFLEKLTENRQSLSGEGELVREAAEVIWTNIDHFVNVDTIVQKVPATRRTLERHFRQQLGLTIREVVALARLELAKWLLTETSLSIGTIAMKAGYSSSDWMGKVVRRNTGSTPSEYRSQSR